MSKRRNKRRRRIQKAIICLCLLFLIAVAVLLLATAARFLFAPAEPTPERPPTTAAVTTAPPTTAPPTTKPPTAQQEQARTAHSSKIIKGVPLIHQFPAFPTGCESVSAVMLMQHAGASVTVDSFVDDYLEKRSDFYSKDGKSYGPDPYQYFLGSPRSTASYGCMAPVIEKAMRRYYGSSEHVVNATGTDFPALCARYIDNDLPVMVWVSIKMLKVYPSASWYLENGQQYSWPANEHCMVLVGYDEQYYYFHDPYTGKKVKYQKAVTEDRYEKLGKQALVVVR